MDVEHPRLDAPLLAGELVEDALRSRTMVSPSAVSHSRHSWLLERFLHHLGELGEVDAVDALEEDGALGVVGEVVDDAHVDDRAEPLELPRVVRLLLVVFM